MEVIVMGDGTGVVGIQVYPAGQAVWAFTATGRANDNVNEKRAATVVQQAIIFFIINN
jgi:hypothetical protein